jgi:hypothetical protein
MSDPRRILRGIKIHRDMRWNYSFWYPSHWYRYDMEDQYGFVYCPEQDPRTGFHVSVKDLSATLEKAVTEDDLPALKEGLMAGLRGLPDCEILREKEITKGLSIGFEVMLTFTLDGQICKRLMRLLYNDRQQFTLYGQGLPVSEYEVFHDIFEFMYLNFVFGDFLTTMGIMLPPSITVDWRGDREHVAFEPLQPRVHD